MAAGVEFAVAFGNHVVAVIVSFAVIAAFVFRAGRIIKVVRAFSRIVAPPPPVIARTIDVVMNISLSYRSTEEVTGVHGEPDLLARLGKLRRPGYLHLEFGLLVLLNFKRRTGPGAPGFADVPIVS